MRLNICKVWEISIKKCVTQSGPKWLDNSNHIKLTDKFQFMTILLSDTMADFVSRLYYRVNIHCESNIMRNPPISIPCIHCESNIMRNPPVLIVTPWATKIVHYCISPPRLDTTWCSPLESKWPPKAAMIGWVWVGVGVCGCVGRWVMNQ